MHLRVGETILRKVGWSGSSAVEAGEKSGDGAGEFGVEDFVGDFPLGPVKGVEQDGDDDGEEEGVPDLDAPADGLGEDHDLLWDQVGVGDR